MGRGTDKVISLNIPDTSLLSVLQFDITFRSSAKGEEWLQLQKLIFNQFNSIIFYGMYLSLGDYVTVKAVDHANARKEAIH